MLSIFFQFSIAAIVTIGAGILLTKSADRIAEETGLGKALVGTILLAGATSLPELVVDFNAVWLNQPDLAVGDLLGSSLFNLLILASVDTFYRHPRRAFSNKFVHHAQTAVLSINLTALAGIGILAQQTTSFLGVGLFTWIVAIVYLIGVRITFDSHPQEITKNHSSRMIDLATRKSLIQPILRFIVATGIILIAAPFLVRAADQLATRSGLGHTFVGTGVAPSIPAQL